MYKLFALLFTFLIAIAAVLGILLVFGLLDQGAFNDSVLKAGEVVLILAVAGAIIMPLLRSAEER